MRWLGLSVALLASIALADTIAGKVVGVHDGDSLTVLVDQHQIKVRLADIDALELKQAFGQRSKQSLSDLCFQKSATLEDQGRDRYGRTIARVRCAGENANREQVRRGMAWVFDRYVKDRSLVRGPVGRPSSYARAMGGSKGDAAVGVAAGEGARGGSISCFRPLL